MDFGKYQNAVERWHRGMELSWQLRFKACKSDAERFDIAERLVAAKGGVEIRVMFDGKDRAKAEKAWKMGNNFFGKRNYERALERYNEAIVYYPLKKGQPNSEFAQAVGDRFGFF